MKIFIIYLILCNLKWVNCPCCGTEADSLTSATECYGGHHGTDGDACPADVDCDEIENCSAGGGGGGGSGGGGGGSGGGGGGGGSGGGGAATTTAPGGGAAANDTSPGGGNDDTAKNDTAKDDTENIATEDSGSDNEKTTEATTEPTTTTVFIQPTFENRPDLPDQSGCAIFSPDHSKKPIYIQKLNDFQSIIMPKYDLIFRLRRDIKMIAMCPGGFEDNEGTSIINLECINGRLINEDTNGPFQGLLKCATIHNSQFFIRRTDGSCPKTLFVFGLNISGQMLSFAESCYDLINQRVYYVHYRAMRPSQYVTSYIPDIFLIDNAYDEVRNWDQIDDRYVDRRVVDQQEKRIKVRRDINMTDDILTRSKRAVHRVKNQFIYKKIQSAVAQVYSPGVIPENFKEIPKQYYMKVIKEFLGEDSSFISYNRLNLLASDIYEPYLQNPFLKRAFLQRTYAWDNLAYGNWRLFHKLLRLHSKYEQFEIYIGFSKTTHAPKCKVSTGCIAPINPGTNMYLKRKILQAEEGETQIHVGKYLWVYLQSDDPGKSFVVIGVNAPYYELFPDSQLVCNDMCDKIPWLEKLERFRHDSAFGIIKCCPVADVKDKLTGFPKYG